MYVYGVSYISALRCAFFSIKEAGEFFSLSVLFFVIKGAIKKIEDKVGEKIYAKM